MECVDETKQTPLFIAIKKRNKEAVKLLLISKCSVRVPNVDMGRTHLHLLAGKGDVDMLQTFLEYDNEKFKDILDNALETPLYSAVKYRRVECVKLLIKSGADLRLRVCLMNVVTYLNYDRILMAEPLYIMLPRATYAIF
jgi:ankyrin repeat protein